MYAALSSRRQLNWAEAEPEGEGEGENVITRQDRAGQGRVG
jgi:hypothetical protein